MTSKSKIFLTVLFSLAAIGLVSVLQTNPMMLVLSIALTGGVFYLLSRFLNGRRTGDKGYQKALRNQKKKGKLTPSDMHKLTRLKKAPRDIPFKVIEGNKKSKPPKDKEKQSHFH